MIASKQIAFGGGKRKPYDAEIEYLESTGTQWIDTGIKLSQDDTIEVEVYHVDSVVFRSLFGAYSLPDDNAGKNACYIARAQRTILFAFGVGAVQITMTNAFSVGRWFRLVSGPYERSIFDITANTYLLRNTEAKAYTFTTDDNCWIFNLATTPNTYSKPASMRCRRFSILRDGVARLDLFSVRVGAEGAMYDKVSGKLFGNAGTGEFVLGPDI